MGGDKRHGKLFWSGGNQVVRIPREFELPGKEVIISKEGERLVIEIAPTKSLLAVLSTLSPLPEDFASIPDRPPDPADL